MHVGLRSLTVRAGVIGLALAGIPSKATATLGGDASSVNSDRVKIQGALIGISRSERFTVHQLQSSAGTTVREYVAPSGTVFAVSWEGPWMPDLQQTLGPYFEAFQRSAPVVRSNRRAHGPMTIRTGDLVVQLGGHPRAFVGRAYVERLLPAGVQPDTIR